MQLPLEVKMKSGAVERSFEAQETRWVLPQADKAGPLEAAVQQHHRSRSPIVAIREERPFNFPVVKGPICCRPSPLHRDLASLSSPVSIAFFPGPRPLPAWGQSKPALPQYPGGKRRDGRTHHTRWISSSLQLHLPSPKAAHSLSRSATGSTSAIPSGHFTTVRNGYDAVTKLCGDYWALIDSAV